MLELLGFLVGVHLTIVLLASMYRVIDLWYCISGHWLEVAARISLTIGIIFVIYFLSRGDFRDGFYTGQIFFGCFHVGIFWVGRLQIAYMRRFL